MVNTHKTIVHGRCPINGSWDYYDVTVETPCFVKAELVEKAANAPRNGRGTQEELARVMFEYLRECAEPVEQFKLSFTGRHGQNVQTIVELSTDEEE